MAHKDASSARFAGTVDSLAPARNFLRSYIVDRGWPGSDLDVVIAFGEVIQNVVRHGFHGGNADGSMTITAQISDDCLIVIIEDDAAPSIPREWAAGDRSLKDGGLGLGIVNRIASKVTFEPIPGGNRAILEFLPD